MFSLFNVIFLLRGLLGRMSYVSLYRFCNRISQRYYAYSLDRDIVLEYYVSMAGIKPSAFACAGEKVNQPPKAPQADSAGSKVPPILDTPSAVKVPDTAAESPQAQPGVYSHS